MYHIFCKIVQYWSVFLATIHVKPTFQECFRHQNTVQDLTHDILQLPIFEYHQSLAKLFVNNNYGIRPPVGHHYSKQSKRWGSKLEPIQQTSLYQLEIVALPINYKYVG